MYEAVFPICYCPPVSWFAAASQHDGILLEVKQAYRKQSYTNRMHIRVANRVMALTIPVERRSKQVPIQDKRISYQEDWQRTHQRSIHFAYQNSPFYAFYEDTFRRMYTQQEAWLLDYLWEWNEILFDLLKKKIVLGKTIDFKDEIVDKQDFRLDFDPTRKRQPSWFQPMAYPQVFEGFEADLSVIDLLCNEGPNSLLLLKQMKASDSA